MRIAYLIIAHAQPRQVAALIEALDGNHARFFIHVDAKADLARFRQSVGSPRAVFIESRLPVYWGGWNIVQATLNLIRCARADGAAFDYYQLLSDSCFPLKSNQAILARLSASTDSYLSIDEEVTPASPFHWWIAQYHANGRPGVRALERHLPYNLARRAVSRLLPRRVPDGMRVYKGGQWWCLHRDCVDYVMNLIARSPGTVRFFKRVRIPDELFFHTLIGNSPFAARLSPGFDRNGLTGNHFIAWHDQKPVVLTESHYAELLASPAPFARKFIEGPSDRVVAMLGRAIAAPAGAGARAHNGET